MWTKNLGLTFFVDNIHIIPIRFINKYFIIINERMLVIMPKKIFTDDEIDTLLSNPYTKNCSPTTIKFTDKFYEVFWIKYLENLPIKNIVTYLGYDPDILGTKRIEGIVYTLRRKKLTDEQRAQSITRSSTNKRPPDDVDYSAMATNDAIKIMQTELIYLRQEVNFLKKISSTAKQK